MAALGAVVQHYVKFPGFESVPSGLAASITAPGSYGFVARHFSLWLASLSWARGLRVMTRSQETSVTPLA